MICGRFCETIKKERERTIRMWMRPIEIPIEIQIEPHVAHVHLASTTQAPHVTRREGGR